MRDQLLTHLPALRRYAHALAGNRADAEDLVQDCVVRAMARERGWRGENLRAWLFAILTNRHRNLRRGARRAPPTRPLDEADGVAAPMPEPDPLERDRLDAALQALPPERRAVLLLVVLEQLSYAEAAAVLGIPLGTVMSRLSRARRQLAATLRRDNIVPLRRDRSEGA